MLIFILFSHNAFHCTGGLHVETAASKRKKPQRMSLGILCAPLWITPNPVLSQVRPEDLTESFSTSSKSFNWLFILHNGPYSPSRTRNLSSYHYSLSPVTLRLNCTHQTEETNSSDSNLQSCAVERPENRGTCTLPVRLLSRLASKPFGTNFVLCSKPKDPSCLRYCSQRCSLNSLSVCLSVMRKYCYNKKSRWHWKVCKSHHSVGYWNTIK